MKILFFIRDFSPENLALAKEQGLIIRDAKAYTSIDFLETCDFVCGDVPKAYADVYPLYDLTGGHSDVGVDDTLVADEPKPKRRRKTEKSE